ncbi:MAG: hypothetical protein IAG10_00365 [Planctomycetaceae bacterium]|nr:hypothetical protein [Planctomycetaceae bacterium]
MPNASLVPSALLDAAELARMLSVSKPTIWRIRDKLPPCIALTSQCIRWRRRTGNPATGIEDWLDAGCPVIGATETTREDQP